MRNNNELKKYIHDKLNSQRTKKGDMHKSQKGIIIIHKCDLIKTRTKYNESRYLLQPKLTDYQIKFGTSRRNITRKRSINREVASIEVIKKLLILATSGFLQP